MRRFIQRHGSSVIGSLSGMDRMRFRGTLRMLANVDGMSTFLTSMKVLLKDFSVYMQEVTGTVREATRALAEAAGRRIVYLPSSSRCKEEVAREIAEKDHVRQGLIAVLRQSEKITFTNSPW